MTTSNETELKRLEAELEKTTAQERAAAALYDARGSKDVADEALSRVRCAFEDAESRLRFHEHCMKSVPDLIAEARFSPQRMLLPIGSGLSTGQRASLVGISEAIADLRGFLEMADLRAARLRKDVSIAKKPIAAAEAAAKAAGATVARCQEAYDASMCDAQRQFEREYLKNN